MQEGLHQVPTSHEVLGARLAAVTRPERIGCSTGLAAFIAGLCSESSTEETQTAISESCRDGARNHWKRCHICELGGGTCSHVHTCPWLLARIVACASDLGASSGREPVEGAGVLGALTCGDGLAGPGEVLLCRSGVRTRVGDRMQVETGCVAAQTLRAPPGGPEGVSVVCVCVNPWCSAPHRLSVAQARLICRRHSARLRARTLRATRTRLSVSPKMAQRSETGTAQLARSLLAHLC